MAITHSFVSAKPPAADPTEVGSTEWNAAHALTFGTGAGDIAEGSHAHSGVYEPADATIVKTGNANWIDLTDAGLTTLHKHQDLNTVTAPATNILTLTNAAAATLALNITSAKTLTLTAADNYNLTIPATGTAALLARANVFTTQQMVDGTSDQIQLRVQAHSTQTTAIQTWEASWGGALMTLSGAGNLGLGVAPITNSVFYSRVIYTNTTDVSGDLNTGNFTALFNPASASSANIRGLKCLVQSMNAQAMSGSIQGLFGQVQHNNTNTLAAAHGLYFAVNNISTGTITTANCILANGNTTSGPIGTLNGINIVLGTSAAAGVVTTANGIYIDAPYATNGGTITTAYGIQVRNISVASTNYAIYTNAGLVHFGDTVDLASGKNLTLLAGNITTDTTTGTKIGTATGQKLGFWNATPIIQPAGATQAAPAAYVTGAFGLDSDANMQALYDLVVAMRTALVNTGIMKGAA